MQGRLSVEFVSSTCPDLPSALDRISVITAETATQSRLSLLQHTNRKALAMSRTKNIARKGTGGVKRKRPEEDDGSGDGPLNRQPSKKSATVDGITSKQPQQTVFDKTIAKDEPEKLAERFTSAIKKHKGELSTIELEDESMPVKAFANTTDYVETRLVKNLANFLEQYTEGGSEELKSCAEETGSPHTILLTSSAIRAQALLQQVRPYGSQANKIAKLFAKHMKQKDHIEYVRKTKFGIGAGTANRIEVLIEKDVLKLENLKRVVIDGSYVDEKQRTIFTDRDAFVPTLSLLNLEQLKLRLVSGETEILVF